MLEGGDPNATFRVMKVLWIMLLCINLFLLSPDPDPSNVRGSGPNAKLRAIKVLKVYAGLGYFQEEDPI